ncbi:TIGR03943 family protein [Kitasatospora sp. NPDC056138]|uniref:TIGR03943 family putative permease subunit n=1 Tax=Kitasatospora sp. NPDC056138 TaxID=3345724 RepID=UPI0035D8340E
MVAAVRREVQAILLVLLGTALLRISLFSDSYLRYVRAALQPYLVATGVVLVLLGVASAVATVRALRTSPGGGFGPGPAESSRPDHPDHQAAPDDHHGHDHHGHSHHGGPRIAWLLTLPVLAIVLVAPPALGSYTAQRSESTTVKPAGTEPTFPPLPAGDPLSMTLASFDVRAVWDTAAPLRGRRVKLVGFATSRKGGGWYLTRLTISCCAADALTSKVEIRGGAATTQVPPPGSWVEVVGVWQPDGQTAQDDTIPALTAAQVTRIPEPRDPYE